MLVGHVELLVEQAVIRGAAADLGTVRSTDALAMVVTYQHGIE